MAEGLARHLARARGLDLSFSSAGVAAPEGHPASEFARVAPEAVEFESECGFYPCGN